MKAERIPRAGQDLRWRIGLLVFVVLALVGGACAAWTLQQLRASGARSASQDAQAMAESVAQTLAQQLGRAVRLGIPLETLPGVAPYLQAALARQPVLIRIAVLRPDGSALHSAAAPTAARGDGGESAHTARVPIATSAAPSAPAGAVEVRVAGEHFLTDSLASARQQAALAVLALAACAALAAALGPGARLERQRRLLQARLAEPAGTARSPSPARMPAAPALEALDQGDADLRAAREAVQAYADELLATDFDGRLRADIERIVRAATAAPGLPG